MSLFAVVPVKDLRGTKSRLAPILDPCARAGLTLYMMRRVVRALLEAGVDEVCVVSPDGIVLEEAKSVGATPLQQKSRGLNEALEEGREFVLERGASSLLVVPADLPLIEAADLRELVEAADEGAAVTISPDGARMGTNALLLSPPGAMPFRFGVGSFEAHLAAARERGLQCAVRENEHLAFDLDTNGDLARLGDAGETKGQPEPQGVPCQTVHGSIYLYESGRLLRLKSPREIEEARGAVLNKTETLTTRDLRVSSIRPLIPPAILLEQLPLSEASAATVRRARENVVGVLNGEDDRLVVVVGPCSIHDPDAAIDYGRRLKEVSGELADDLLVVMRVYFEKPRTTVGWKGLINDPHLDGTFDVNEGLRLGRKLVLDLAEMGMPAGTEFLDPITPQFFSDVLAWAAIGARTTESQVHRQLASGLSMPVGFKNGTGGGVQISVDAVGAAIHPHSFLGVTEQGLAGIVTTEGNPDCHIILRGGKSGPNYGARSVRTTLDLLEKANLPPRVLIDASHANSDKDYRRQPEVVADVASQVAGGQSAIVGVMMESFITGGAQSLTDKASLTYGQSITDSCMGWEMTVPVLHELAKAVRARRKSL